MISLETIENLTKEELGFLICMLNILFPRITDATPSILKCYKTPILKQHLLDARDKITDEAYPVYESVCNKLLVEVTTREAAAIKREA